MIMTKEILLQMLRKGKTGDEILMILDAIASGESEDSEEETEG